MVLIKTRKEKDKKLDFINDKFWMKKRKLF